MGVAESQELSLGWTWRHSEAELSLRAWSGEMLWICPKSGLCSSGSLPPKPLPQWRRRTDPSATLSLSSLEALSDLCGAGNIAPPPSGSRQPGIRRASALLSRGPTQAESIAVLLPSRPPLIPSSRGQQLISRLQFPRHFVQRYGMPSKGSSASAWLLVSQFPIFTGEAERIPEEGTDKLDFSEATQYFL